MSEPAPAPPTPTPAPPIVVPEVVPTPPPAPIEISRGSISKRDIIIAVAILAVFVGVVVYLNSQKPAPKAE